jgi:beta-lactamase regulating signal transducer with metallopeptidase domain
MTPLLSPAWLVYLLVAGTLLTLAARATAETLSLAGRSTRWVWAATLAGILALGLVAPRARSVEVVAATMATTTSVAPAVGTVGLPGVSASIEALHGWIESAAVGLIALASGRIPAYVATVAAVTWIMVSAVLLALYVIVNVKVARARRRWPRKRLQGVDVRVAPNAGPAVIGVLRAEIVVPRSLMERTADEQRLILAHEYEHLSARDNVLLGAACAVVIALPWHPAVWYVLARLRLAIELDCDARVLRHGAAARPYGALLIDMAAQGTGIRVGTLALADRPTHLERRLLAMRSHKTRFVLVRAGALSAAAGLLVLAACEAKMPTAADVASMDVTRAQKSAAEAGFLRTSSSNSTDFFVNGAKVTPEQARAMEAKNIGSIEVVKSELAAGRDTIIVTTVDRMPKDVGFALTNGDSKRREEIGHTLLSVKKTLDSSEHTVARVERAIGETRTRLETGPSSRAILSPPPRMKSWDGGEPVFMIDGKQVSSAEFAAIRGEDIAAVSVYKGETALKMSSAPGAKYGVIVVNKKKSSRTPQ